MFLNEQIAETPLLLAPVISVRQDAFARYAQIMGRNFRRLEVDAKERRRQDILDTMNEDEC